MTESRRTLLRSSIVLVPGVAEALQHAHESTKSPVARIEFLSSRDASEIEALAGEIIPTDSSPGAKEAGVVSFIGRALKPFDRDKPTTDGDHSSPLLSRGG